MYKPFKTALPWAQRLSEDICIFKSHKSGWTKKKKKKKITLIANLTIFAPIQHSWTSWFDSWLKLFIKKLNGIPLEKTNGKNISGIKAAEKVGSLISEN